VTGTMMKNYKLILAYEGTSFKGWQRQSVARSVQGTIEEALAKISGRKIAVHGAGRTDAGVHALAQVASFRASIKLDEKTLMRAMNAVLPADVRIESAEEAPPEFHARKSAISKIYEYRIINRPVISPFDRRYALHWPYRLKLKEMKRADGLFVRRADFTAFSSNRDRSPVRTVVRSEIRAHGGLIIYTIEADGFLRYMVRAIVGTLLEIGRGKIPAEDLEKIFASKDRSLAGPTVPPQGLFLSEVRYRAVIS